MSHRESSKETTTMNPEPSVAPPIVSLRTSATRVALALACALVALFALAVAPAGATVIHESEGSFNGAERPLFETFESILPSVAVDQSSGDVWITESKFLGSQGKADVVDKFNSKGEYANVQITGEGTPQGAFSFGAGIYPGIAVDNTVAGSHKGDLYVSDTGNGVVDRFSDAGAFECQITGKTPVSGEEIAHECNGAAGSLTPDGSIEPAGLAVDSAGDLYVADTAHQAIDIFGPSGAYKTQIKDSHLTGVATIALDSAGDLYVTNLNENVVEFDSSGHFVSTIDEGSSPGAPAGVAIDPTNNHLYVGVVENENHGRAIAEYEPSGALVDVFAPSSNNGIAVGYLGLGVGPTGKIYAAELNRAFGAVISVLIYGPDLVVPTASTHGATAVEETSATLHGHLDPDAAHGGGEVTSCQFEYGFTNTYGETAPCSPAPPYSSSEDVSANVTGLRPSSTYHFRLEAANANGPSMGEDETLTTGGPPSVDHQVAEGRTTSVLFLAKIDPWGSETTCQVQYVADATFQQSQWANATTQPCRPEDLGSGFGDVRTRFLVTGLARETTYHYRFLVGNKAGVTDGPGATFETYGIDAFSMEELKSSHIAGNGEWSPGEPEILQAGAHPYELVTTVELSKTTVLSEYVIAKIGSLPPPETEFRNFTGVDTKDIHTELPPGLIGNPNATPKCSRFLVNSLECPGDTMVGRFEVWVDSNTSALNGEGTQNGPPSYSTPLYNLAPSGHNPAEFGTYIQGQVGAWIPFSVRTGGDYGITADSIDISALAVPEKVRVRVWGVPADPAHDVERECPTGHGGYNQCSSDQPLKPLLMNPTFCTGSQTVTAAADSWQEPGKYVKKTTEMPGYTGCNQLQFKPTLEALPTTNVADSPSGLHVDLHVPQDLNSEGFEDPNGLVTADLKDSKVTLPPGLIVNPASASGLAACSPTQIELHGPEPAQCPDAAKIGRVEIDTPLIDHPLPGSVYVATPYDNPFNSLLAIYVAVDDPETGVVVKLAGHVEANPETGQLTTTFEETPRLPFEDFKLEFFGGPRAALRTAPTCGTYESASVLTPWSAPESGPAVTLSDPFQITSAPDGAPCPAQAAEEPDSPSFSAGTETPVAGSYSPFVLSVGRKDDSQELKGIDTVLPPGLTAKLAGVAECPDAAIEAARHKTGREEQESPSCPAGSEVGTVNVGAGAGPAPYFTTGRVYLAGPYKGAPFSLAIITPAVAGPYDLGDVVVRAALFVNPETAQVTVKSDPIPTILDGIPLDVRTIEVRTGRPDFTLNPTSCEKMAVGGETLSALGQSVALSSSFQVGGCEGLGFKPGFKASTSGKTSREDGASLHVSLTYPNAPQGSQANVKSVHVELPKALPSRLSTLRHACLEAVFDQSPGDCPSLSRVGYARAITPVLAAPLEGPAYFVSHGGQKFPELVVVLQGEGITIELHGETFISSAGITSSTFHAVPDQPITSFELTLPQGPDSVLAANGNFCAATKTVLVKRRVRIRVKGHSKTVTRKVKRKVVAPLTMPTTFTAQNGAVLSQNTKIGVSGCSKTKQAKPKKSRHGKSSRRPRKASARQGEQTARSRSALRGV